MHLISSFLRHRTGNIEPIVGEVVEGMVFYEDDIILGTLEEALRVNEAQGTRGLGITGDQFRWPDGKLPFARPEDPELAEIVLEAIEDWQSKTPLRFPERTIANEHRFPNYLVFARTGGCRSFIGMQGGPQSVILGQGCFVPQAIHEIGHAVGLFHEQSRADRDDFIEVLMDNIMPGREFNFRKHVSDGTMIGAYDYESIMHYAPGAFAIRSDLVTLRSRTSQPIRPLKRLSPGDVAAVKVLYPNLDWPTTPPGPPANGAAGPTQPAVPTPGN